MTEHSYLVLGDLGNGRFIVRMFVGEQTFDQEFTCSIVDLPMTVDERMVELAANPDSDLLVDAERPRINPGHAIPLEVE